MAAKKKTTAAAAAPQHDGFVGGGTLETEDKCADLAFDSSGRFLVADDKVFEAGKAEPTELGVESGATFAHPSRPLVAVVHSDGLSFVELVDKRRIVNVKLKKANAGAFDSTGTLFACSAYYDKSVHIYNTLDGKEVKTIALPDEEDTAAAVVFGPKDASIMAFNAGRLVVAPLLKGELPVVHSLAKVKVLSGNARRVGANALFYDTSNMAMVSPEGDVVWTSRFGNEAVAIVPDDRAIALVRMSKGVITFLSPKDGKEIGSVKAKVKSAPLGMACTRTVAAWARDGAIELVSLPVL